MFETKKTLIVVYRDELLMNQLKKMVETHDDCEDSIVGTRDGSVNIVSWTEKVWLGNKKAGNIQGKILFLGDIKGTDKLIPVLDIKFDEYGVKYGWAGNQAVLFIDPKTLIDRKAYDDFLRKLSVLPVPAFLKAPENMEAEIVNTASEDAKETDMGEESPEVCEDENHQIANPFRAARQAFKAGTEAVGKVGNQVVERSEELFRNKKLMKRQMLFYGVVHLYTEGLEVFMNC